MNKYKIIIVDGPCSYYYNEDIIADSKSEAISIVRNKLESDEGTLYAELIQENYNPFIKKYRSIPFEAFLLAPDMSNWREGCSFLGTDDFIDEEYQNGSENPPFLDVMTNDGWVEAEGNCFICKTPDDSYEVWSYELFVKTFEEIID